MAKQPTPAKKVIKTVTAKSETLSGPSSSISRRKPVASSSLTNTPAELTFNKDNIKWLLISVGVVVLGYVLMTGGKMPNHDTWDESIIYSFRRTVISPIVILGGLCLSIYAIFRNKPEKTEEVA
ncbi:MAG: DUF3098 domain-containing protein [Saprospiraceae bacterium]